ncbi:MAG TPA: glycosyltransferase family 1 protein [Gemmatimonadales bacterium]|nr:glycosyltransferase family 1 protein [Gemmatimonadales bacterium]
MKLSLVTDTYLPEINGVTTVLARMRTGLRDRGHQVQVIAPRYPDPGPDEEGIVRRASVPCPGYPAVRLSWPWSGRVLAALDAHGPELVHVVTEGPLGVTGRRWALANGVPLVTSFHTDFPRYAASYLGAWAVGPVRRHLQRFHAAAAHTQTPSAVTRDELRSLGVPNPVVWGRGVDSRVFAPGRRSERRRAAAGAAGRLVVLHVGRLAVEKDVATMATAFRLLHARFGRRLAFWVAGDGPKSSEVRAALPFAAHAGFLARESLAELYADADLFVFPSPTETCGLVALEAMAAGLPVVAADQGGVRENVRTGINGLLVRAGDPEAFADAVGELVADSGRRLAMAQAARAFAVARDWERELDALEPLYASAMRPLPSAEAMPSSECPAGA